MAFLRAHSAECITVGTDPGPESYYKRNRYLVDHADCLVAVYDDNKAVPSGTGMTVQYAQRESKPIILIHPDTGQVAIYRSTI